MMERTQISLSPEDHRRAKGRAVELGISFAEYVRRLVRADLGERRAREDISTVFGIGDSGGSDVARDKDVYIGDAIATNGGRRPRAAS